MKQERERVEGIVGLRGISAAAVHALVASCILLQEQQQIQRARAELTAGREVYYIYQAQ